MRNEKENKTEKSRKKERHGQAVITKFHHCTVSHQPHCLYSLNKLINVLLRQSVRTALTHLHVLWRQALEALQVVVQVPLLGALALGPLIL